MNPFLYDVLRGLRSKGVLILIMLTTLLALTVLVLGLHALVGQPPAAISGFVVNGMGAVYGFFLPVLGIVAGYETYGRERVTGILESVLCRPVTRVNVLVARFLALLVAAALAIGLALTVIDAVLLAQTGTALPAVDFAALFLALFVEASAFGGMVFLFSHVFRSSGALQGLSTVIFVLFSIVWYILIIVSFLALGANATDSSLAFMVNADYFNPAQYTILMTSYITHSLFFGVISGYPSWVGPTAPGLAAAGVGWSVGPFAVATYLAKNRD